MMDKEYIKNLLFKFCSADGVSGREKNISSVAAEELQKYTDVSVDALGNVIGKIDGKGEKISLDAHIDRIGLVVTYITEKGFLKVSPCGGVDNRILDGTSVTVHGSTDLHGVITSVPPHLSDGKEDKPAEIKDISIDVGLSKAECEKLDLIGSVVTFDSDFDCLLNDRVTCGALDDRAGIVSLILAVKMLTENNVKPNLSVVFSVQEETGGSGAKTSSFRFDADEAIAVDVSFGVSPNVNNTEAGVLGKGPMIGFSPSLDFEMSKTLQRIAKEKNIPFQNEVMGGRTGTNADDISVNRNGVMTALISIPLRNMHTPNEVIDLNDIYNTAELIYLYIKERVQNNV